jgi:transposase
LGARLSWKETAECFRTSWDKVFDAVEHVVAWGLEHRTLGQIDAIGVDETQYAKGYKYLTLVYQIDIGITRLLWVGRERTIESFAGFFNTMGQEVISKISFTCSDMWDPYLKVIQEKCSEALHILDRFHIVAKMNKALDEVRAEETRRMKREGRDPVLKKSRGLLLKRSENLGDEQHFRLRDLLRYNLKTVRAYLLKETFQQLRTTTRQRGQASPGRMVPTDYAFPHRTHEENRPFATSTSRTHPQLLPGGKAHFQRRRGRPKQQGQVTMRKSYGFRT